VNALPDLAPRPVARAASTLAEREHDVVGAREAVEQAKAAIQQAASQDRALLADALDAGRDDPGTPNADEARARVVEAERLLEGQELRRERARSALAEAVTSALPGWTAATVKAVEETEVSALDLVAQLRRAVEQREHARRCLYWLEQRASGQKLPNLSAAAKTASTLVINPLAGPGVHTIDTLLDYVRDSLVQSSLAAERVQREEQQPTLHVA
jgi:hypothetical protein